MALEHDQLRPLIDAFYRRVRADDRLGPIFEAHVADWDQHSERLTDFWSSLMLTSGRYKGNPFAQHKPFAAQLDAALFERWLELWRITTEEMFPGPVAGQFQHKARRVAESLKAGLVFDPAARAGGGEAA
jgi:hemoglobin